MLGRERRGGLCRLGLQVGPEGLVFYPQPLLLLAPVPAAGREQPASTLAEAQKGGRARSPLLPRPEGHRVAPPTQPLPQPQGGAHPPPPPQPLQSPAPYISWLGLCMFPPRHLTPLSPCCLPPSGRSSFTLRHKAGNPRGVQF